jgi:hypothetical protein
MPEDSESIKDGRQAVLEGLLRFNENKTSSVPKGISLFMRDRKNRVVGGVLGYTFGDWLHIDILWVEESFRSKHVDLDTFSRQARPFYEKNGYVLFATIDNYPEGHSKHFLKKDLP